jgi:hypothetical protein
MAVLRAIDTLWVRLRTRLAIGQAGIDELLALAEESPTVLGVLQVIHGLGAPFRRSTLVLARDIAAVERRVRAECPDPAQARARMDVELHALMERNRVPLRDFLA